MVPFSAMRTTSLVDGENILKISWTQSLLRHRTHTRYIWDEKIPSMQLKSPLLSGYWTLGRLQAVMKSDLKCSKPWSRSSLADSCMSNGLVFWKSTERLAKWGDHPQGRNQDRANRAIAHPRNFCKHEKLFVETALLSELLLQTIFSHAFVLRHIGYNNSLQIKVPCFRKLPVQNRREALRQ